MSCPILQSGPASYDKAYIVLLKGGLVALPTETVYGLAALATHPKAVSNIYKAKGRPSHNPLILHILDPLHASHWGHVSLLARRLMEQFWPGPLTLVLPKTIHGRELYMPTSLPTLALRCPDVPWRDAFKKRGLNSPLVMPSANRSGHISPTRAAHVAHDLGNQIDLILDGGECPGGLESTVLKIEDDTAILLRPGPITLSDLAPFISDLHAAPKNAPLSAPGMLESHYAPRAQVRLNAMYKNPKEAYLAFGATKVDADLNLSKQGNLSEAAHNLYAMLRQLDQVETIAIAPIPMTGIGLAINDRLRRAAAKREQNS